MAYDPSKYIKDYRWLGDIGRNISKMATTFPEIIEMNRAVKENKKMKQMTSSGISNLIDNLDDVDAMSIANSMGILSESPNASPEEIKARISRNIPGFDDKTTNEEYALRVAEDFFPHFMSVENPGKVLRIIEQMGGKSGENFGESGFATKVYNESIVEKENIKKAEAQKQDAQKGQELQGLVAGGTPQAEAQAQLGMGTKAVDGSLERQAGRDATAENQRLTRENMNKQKELDRELKREIAAGKAETDRLNALKEEKLKNVDPSKLEEKGLKFQARAEALQEEIENADKNFKKSAAFKAKKRLLKETLAVADKYLALSDAIDMTPGTQIPQTSQSAALASVEKQQTQQAQGELVEKYISGEYKDFWKSRGAEKANFERDYKEQFNVDVQYDGDGVPINPSSGEVIDISDFIRPEDVFSNSGQDDPRTTAAKKALNDPNAPEEVKAQARKILGL